VSLEEASTSFMIDSTLSGASAFAENLKIFVNFSAEAYYSRKVTLGFESMSILYLVLNSSEKSRTRA
jgi:hypothetical protein